MKEQLVRQITVKLQQQFATMAAAAKNTHEASTGDEAKQEGKYDTRALEASYLAEAQAEQSKALAHFVYVFKNLQLEDFTPDSDIAPGALVEIEREGEFSHFLLTPCAGGLCIQYEGLEVTTLSPEAPLYQNLIGCRAGDIIEDSGILILEIR